MQERGRAFAQPRRAKFAARRAHAAAAFAARNGPDGTLLGCRVTAVLHSGWSDLFHGRACGPVQRLAGTARRAAEADYKITEERQPVETIRDLCSASIARVVGTLPQADTNMPLLDEAPSQRGISRGHLRRGTPQHVQMSWQKRSRAFECGIRRYLEHAIRNEADRADQPCRSTIGKLQSGEQEHTGWSREYCDRRPTGA